MTFHQSKAKPEAASCNTVNVKISTVYTEKSTQVSSCDFDNTESQEAVSSVEEMCFQTETELNKSGLLQDRDDQPVSSEFDNYLDHSAHCEDNDKSNQKKKQDKKAHTEMKNYKCSETPSELEQNKEDNHGGKHESKVISEAATCVESSESAHLSTYVSQKNIQVSECRTVCNGEFTKVQLEQIELHNVRRSQTDTVQNDLISPDATTVQNDNLSPETTTLTETLKSEKESDKTCGEQTKNNHQSELDDDDVMIIEKDVITIEIDDDSIEPEPKDKPACNTTQQEEPFYTIEQNNSPYSNEMAYDMECENIVEQNTNTEENDGESCDVNGISSLKITSVIGSLDVNKKNENDRNRSQEHNELPDGMVIELNIDNEESGDEVIVMAAEKPSIPVKRRVHKGPKFTRVKRRNSKSLESNNKSRSVMLNNTDSSSNVPPESNANSAMVNAIEQQAQPIMIMSNVFNRY